MTMLGFPNRVAVFMMPMMMMTTSVSFAWALITPKFISTIKTTRNSNDRSSARTNDAKWTTRSSSTSSSTTSTISSFSSFSYSYSSSSSSRSTQLFAKPEHGSIVTIECSLLPEGDFVPEPMFDGIILHEDDPPEELCFILGQGNYLPGLHDLIMERMEKEGDVIGNNNDNKVSLDAGWGSWNPNLQFSMSMESLTNSGIDPSLIKNGVELMLANGITAVVKDVTEEEFTVDANPPLAGASYSAYVKLLKVEPGPTEFVYSPTAGSDSKYQVATFALGCFWGGELEYMREVGVVGTKVGYTQGNVENPSYEQVCSGTTGHTESILVIYDPSKVSYKHLVELAMERLGENKYLLNQVGNDKGTQYRHGVYYHNDEQKAIAEKVVGSFGEDCVTEVKPAVIFYDAESYHQQYLLKGGQSARKGDLSTIRCYG